MPVVVAPTLPRIDSVPNAAVTPPASSGRPGGRAKAWLVLVVVISFVASSTVNAGRSVTAARLTADVANATGDFPTAIALYRAVAARNGPLYWLAPSADTAAVATTRATAAWAQQLAARGEVDAAVALLDSLGSAESRRLRTDILLTSARANATSDPLIALARLDEMVADHPSVEANSQADALRPELEVAAAPRLVELDRAADAVVLLDAALTAGAAGAVADRARSLLPKTLLAAGQQAIAAHAWAEAVALLTRLANDFPTTAAARTARVQIAKPQAVVGTLTRRDGSPIAGRVRLSGHFRRVGSSYVTSGPFFYSEAAATGDFRFDDVPLGGPYVVEVLGASDWTTLIDPATGKPADAVTVTALTPADITFIVIPG